MVEVALNVDRKEMMEGRGVIMKEGGGEVMMKEIKERRVVKVVERRSILG